MYTVELFMKGMNKKQLRLIRNAHLIRMNLMIA